MKRSLIAAGAICAGIAAAVPGGASQASTLPRHAISVRATQYSYVLFGIKGLNNLTLTGTASEIHSSGWSMQLWGQPFPYTSPSTHYATESLASSSTGYAPFSFTVQPTLATKYVEKLYYKTTLHTSVSGGTVYVAQGKELIRRPGTCIGNNCSLSFTLDRFIPGAASATELAKRFYDYLGLSQSSGTPPPPKFLTLRTTGWTQGKTMPVTGSPHEYATKFTVKFTVSEPQFAFAVDVCTKDSESVDGVGLPGSHGCGNQTIPPNPIYLG
jgi:hypothetical protein